MENNREQIERYSHPYKNCENYNDPTAGEALTKIEIDEEDVAFHKLLNAIFYLCELAGFRIKGRITFVKKDSGRIWR